MMVPLARKERLDPLDHLVGLYSRNYLGLRNLKKKLKMVLAGCQGSPHLRRESLARELRVAIVDQLKCVLFRVAKRVSPCVFLAAQCPTATKVLF